jgi:hypothetical protein
LWHDAIFRGVIVSLSISAGLSPQSFSPLSRLQNELTSEVASGAIGSGDQPALSSALNDIDTALKSQTPSPGSPPSPGAIKAKIDDLIAGEVKGGKLTSAQADELKTVFAKAFQGGPSGPGGPHGPGGSGGPHGAGGPGGGGSAGGAKKTDNADPADTNGDGVVSPEERSAYDDAHPLQADAKADAGVTSLGGSGSSSKSDTSKVLSDFLKSVQDSLGKISNYSTNGQSVASQLQSQILDYQA